MDQKMKPVTGSLYIQNIQSTWIQSMNNPAHAIIIIIIYRLQRALFSVRPSTETYAEVLTLPWWQNTLLSVLSFFPLLTTATINVEMSLFLLWHIHMKQKLWNQFSMIFIHHSAQQQRWGWWWCGEGSLPRWLMGKTSFIHVRFCCLAFVFHWFFFFISCCSVSVGITALVGSFHFGSGSSTGSLASCSLRPSVEWVEELSIQMYRFEIKRRTEADVWWIQLHQTDRNHSLYFPCVASNPCIIFNHSTLGKANTPPTPGSYLPSDCLPSTERLSGVRGQRSGWLNRSVH